MGGVERARSHGLMAITAEDTTVAGDEAGSPPGDRSFRPDVQGLRAVAVVLVVLFHANIPGLRGGYVGVDVFYVISGFVITGVLLRERARAGSTSLLHFYRVGSAASSRPPRWSSSPQWSRHTPSWAAPAAIRTPPTPAGPRSFSSTSTSPRPGPTIWPHRCRLRCCRITGRLPSRSSSTWCYPAVFLVVAASLVAKLASPRGSDGSSAWRLSPRSSGQLCRPRTTRPLPFFSPLPRVWELALGGLVTVGPPCNYVDCQFSNCQCVVLDRSRCNCASGFDRLLR